MVDVINGHLSRQKTPIEEFKQITRDLIINLDRSARGLARATEYIGDVTHMLSRGQLKINMEMLGGEEPMSKISLYRHAPHLGMITAGALGARPQILSQSRRRRVARACRLRATASASASRLRTGSPRPPPRQQRERRSSSPRCPANHQAVPSP